LRAQHAARFEWARQLDDVGTPKPNLDRTRLGLR
jgi:hypothetical protein